MFKYANRLVHHRQNFWTSDKSEKFRFPTEIRENKSTQHFRQQYELTTKSKKHDPFKKHTERIWTKTFKAETDFYKNNDKPCFLRI